MTIVFHPTKGKIPRHIGIIPDGGRRWAKINCKTYIESYRFSMALLIKLIDLLFSKKVEIISIYFSSIQNFRRTDSEIYAFCKAESEFCYHYLREYANLFDAQVTSAGMVNILPDYMQNALDSLEKETEKFTRRKIFLCVAYDPIEEIYNAVSKSKDKQFTDKLWIPYPVDMIIRSGGANLTSNFLLAQSGFARLYFLEELFNDIALSDIDNLISEFTSLNRLYGE